MNYSGTNMFPPKIGINLIENIIFALLQEIL